MDDHNHINVFGQWIADNWAWISGITVTLLVSAGWITRLYLRNLKLPHHVTHAELEECEEGVLIRLEDTHQSVLLKLSDHEREECARADAAEARHEVNVDDAKRLMIEYRQENMSAHAEIKNDVKDFRTELSAAINNLRAEVIKSIRGTR